MVAVVTSYALKHCFGIPLSNMILFHFSMYSHKGTQSTYHLICDTRPAVSVAVKVMLSTKVVQSYNFHHKCIRKLYASRLHKRMI